MTRQSFYPFRSERAKAEYEAFSLDRAKAWPIPSETMLIDTASGQTFVRASGRITDPSLVLLPGVRFGSLMALVEEAIADVQLAVRLFDLPRPVQPTVIDDKAWQGFSR